MRLAIKHLFTELSNKLTLLRVMSIPLMVGLHYIGQLSAGLSFFYVIATIIFAIAMATDFFDGFFARKLKTESRFGALIDPLADKLLICSALILLHASDQLYTWLVILLIGREIFVNGLRLIALEYKAVINVGWYGKFKTATQAIAILFLMPNRAYMFDYPIKSIGMIIIWIATLLSLWSAFEYWQKFNSIIIKQEDAVAD